jgi:hypothetical protein
MDLSSIQPPPAEPSPGSEWIATVMGIQKRLPVLGSVGNINRLMLKKDGLPFHRLGGRLIFNVPEILDWLNRQPGHNLPTAV